MRSTDAPASSVTPVDDRTTKARIRDAAVECFAEHGVAATSARKVAEAAGVSAGLVIHHFGSMDGLRTACDEYVTAVIRRKKQEAMSAGPTGFDLLAALHDGRLPSLTRYLAHVLAENSPTVAALVDELIADARVYLRQGAESGVLRRTDDPGGVAAVLTIWQLGALVMHHHVARVFGVDPTEVGGAMNPALAAYLAPGYEILGEGILTDEAAVHLRSAVAAIAASGGAAPSIETTATRPTSKGIP